MKPFGVGLGERTDEGELEALFWLYRTKKLFDTLGAPLMSTVNVCPQTISIGKYFSTAATL